MAAKTNGSSGAINALDINPLTSSEVAECIEVCIAAPMDGYPGHDDCLWGLPILVWGEPGIAKTARIKQIAKAIGEVIAPVYAGRHPPEDFSGALIPDGTGDARQICAIPKIKRLIKRGSGILFFDEINGAASATQGALMSVIHERDIGDESIPSRVRIVSAANPEEIATGGSRLSPPLANRFIHINDPGPSSREWAKWLMGSSEAKLQVSLERIEETVIQEWPDVFPETQGLFAGFIEAKPDVLHKRPALSDKNSGKSWASPRTWDFATRAWTTSRILEKSDQVRDALIRGCVGQGAAEALLEYATKTKLPKPMDVLSGKWQPDPDRLDIILAGYSAAVAYVRQRPEQAEKIKLAPKAWECLLPLFELGLADIVVPAVEGLVQERLGIRSGVEEVVKAAKKVLVPLSKTGLATILEERPTT